MNERWVFLQKAAEDFRYLLNRGYPRKASLELVGNRYTLRKTERDLLHRGVFSDKDSNSRKRKRLSPSKIRNNALAIDGYNVLITIEAGLLQRPLILGDDGFIRDISGLSSRYKPTEITGKAIRLILRFLKKLKPRSILFLFDAPMSQSGVLAKEVRDLLKKEGFQGEAQTHPYPEKILNEFSGIIATSDTAIIDQSKQVMDLAGEILKRYGYLTSLMAFKKKNISSEKNLDKLFLGGV